MHEGAIRPLLKLAAGRVQDIECVKQAVFAIGSLSEVDEVFVGTHLIRS